MDDLWASLHTAELQYVPKVVPTTGVAGRADLIVDGRVIGWVWKRDDGLWDSYVREPGQAGGRKISNGAGSRRDAIFRAAMELEYDHLMERIALEDEKREQERKEIFGSKRIDYCKVCGTRIQKIRGWKHQRPQPSGEPWDHAPVPGGSKSAIAASSH